MIPIIGIMIGAYIFTRMLDLIMDEGDDPLLRLTLCEIDDGDEFHWMMGNLKMPRAARRK